MKLRPLIAALLMGALVPQAPAQTVVQAPHYGDTLFEFFQDRHFEAITGLMASQQFGRIAPHDDEAEVLRGGMLLAYGMHHQAGEVFARLIERNAAPAVRDRAWYFLAKIRYQRGLFAEADEALGKVANALPGELEDERQLLGAQLKLAQDDPKAAAAVLAKIPPGAAASPFARFNLGVALVRSGDGEKGRALLDELGRAVAANEDQRTLRDRANVALGFAALSDKKPEQARAVLQRVRLNAAQSNKALLGFGWAAAEMKQPREALVPWTELAGRDIGDAAVLEARIALPYAYAELGATRQALDGYDDAVALYAKERVRLDESITAVRGGALVRTMLERNASATLGGAAGLSELPPMPHATHLSQLLASHEFQESFKNLRDLQFLGRNLDDWRGKLGVYDDMLANRRQGYAERLPKVRQAAGEINLPALTARRDALAGALTKAEAEADAGAFVDERQRGLLERIERVRAGIAQVNDPEIAERLRRVAGALTWELTQAYPERVWNAKKALRATDRLMAETRERDDALLKAQRDEPARFDAFAARIAQLTQRVQALTPRVAALAGEQQAALQEMAVGRLQAQQERLDVYSAQARLAIAQILDRAQVAAKSEDGDAKR